MTMNWKYSACQEYSDDIVNFIVCPIEEHLVCVNWNQVVQIREGRNCNPPW